MSFGSDSPGGAAEGIGGNESGIGSSDGMGGFGGFGGLGIGNPGSYGGSNEPEHGGPTGIGFGGVPGGFSVTGINPDGTPQGSPGGMGGGLGIGNIGIAGSDLGIDGIVAQTLSTMTPAQQMQTFPELDAIMSAHYGTLGKVSVGLMKSVLSKFGNVIAPGLGTLGSLTGITGAIANKVNDMAAHQAMAAALGVGTGLDAATSVGGTSGEYITSDIFQQAIDNGMSPEEIFNKINEVVESSGGSTMGFWEDIIGDTSANAATGAAGTAANYQTQALNYLKARDIVPRVFAEGAMKRLGGFYGLEGGEEDVMNRYMESPIYANLQAGRNLGEESIMRNAAMTGGLRSGNTQEALYDYNVQAENQALGQYMGGLDRFTSYPSYATQIANQTSGIGQTLAQGQLGAAQAQQAGTANLIGLGGSVYQALGGWEGIKDIGSDIYSGIASLF